MDNAAPHPVAAGGASRMRVREASLRVARSLHEVDRAAAWLDEFSAGADVPPAITAKLQVVLDEVLSNVIRHGSHGRGEVLLELRRRSEDVELEVTDDGPPFDPTQFASVPLGVRVAERQLGGAGLLFVRALMDEISFARQDGCNRLILRKRLLA